MNWNEMEAKWKQLAGAAKQEWGRLTDDDLKFIAGKKDELLGKLQERYGITKDEALKRIEQWKPADKPAETMPSMPQAAEPPRERKAG